jgi:hypothetical protein
MRKTLISLIALSLIATAPLAAGAVKAGDSCKKVGQTSTTQGKKYTCIKSGKKLIWNKGNIITAVVPTPTPSASPTPTPTPSATPVVVEIKAGQNCQTQGELSKNSDGPLECRELANNNRLWIQLSSNPTGAKNSTASEDVNICKLPDLRSRKTPGQGAAFPLTDRAFSSIGEARVAIIPIDFSDAPGEATLPQIIESEKKKVDSWLAFNSQGKQTYKWNIINEWVRAPKTSEQYNWQNPGNPRGVQTQSDSEIYNQLFTAVGNRIDLSKLDYAFLLFPSAQKGIQGEIAGRQRQVSTAQGNVVISFFGAGAYFVDTKQETWRIWVHEIMHSTGLAMHAPGNGSPLHIGGNQTGASSVLSGWDKFVSGWIDDSQVYCLQAANVANQKITLASADNSDSGYKLGIIKITQSTAIVVESRRRGVFSEGFPAGTYGLNAYVVQTAQDNERCDGCNQDDIEKKQFAYYLRADGVDRGMFNFPMAPPTRWSIFVRQGESVSFEGVKVTLETTGDYDTISITK